MAEGIFRIKAAEKGIEVDVKSAGIFACTGDSPTPNAVLAAGELGADISSHRATVLTSYLVDWADLIVAMTPSHRSEAVRLYPEIKGKIIVLGYGISDPYGGDLFVYRECAGLISEGIDDLLNTEGLFGDCQKCDNR